jgi:peptidoglycan/xylan/chitin deacetylase (PgdA/CDA1 family)
VTLVPIVLYHSVSSDPPPVSRGFSVDAPTLARHLDLVVERGLRALTVSQLLDAMGRGDTSALARAVVITFDDGFADFASAALPALRDRGLTATLFVATGLLRGGPEPPVYRALAPHMLEWSQLADLHAAGIEIGGHSHTHPQLDTLGTAAVREEVGRCTGLLSDALAMPVRVFAYPHGYSSPRVRRVVADAGYRGACAVRNTLTGPGDDEFALGRLMVTSETDVGTVESWLARRAARPIGRESARTRGWRAYRRGRALVTRRPGRDPGWAALRG